MLTLGHADETVVSPPRRDRGRWHEAGAYERVAASAAVAFVALMGAGMLVLALDGATSAPRPDASNAEYAEFFADHRAAHLANMYLAGAALLVALPVFALALAEILWRAERTGHLLSRLVATGGVLVAVMSTLNALAWGAAAYSVAADGDASVSRAFHDLGNTGLFVAGLPAALMVVAASLAAARARVLPTWLVRAGFVLGGLLVLAVPIEAMALGFLLFGAWIVAVAGVLVLRPIAARQLRTA